MGDTFNQPNWEAGSPAFPAYPEFTESAIPDDVRWAHPMDGTRFEEPWKPIRAWQGTIRPFDNDEDAKKTSRILALDRSIDVQGGKLLPPAKAKQLRQTPSEHRIVECNTVFDVLILEFPAPADPWAFSLSPAISHEQHPNHPHLRTDRILKLPSRTLHGLCVLSAAEFDFDRRIEIVPQFLHQVAIYLGKHVIWSKTQEVRDLRTGRTIHAGRNSLGNTKDIPPQSCFQSSPIESWGWRGYWPGTSALGGPDHLKLDPEGHCWCGTRKKYKLCCRPEEEKMYSALGLL